MLGAGLTGDLNARSSPVSANSDDAARVVPKPLGCRSRREKADLENRGDGYRTKLVRTTLPGVVDVDNRDPAAPISLRTRSEKVRSESHYGVEGVLDSDPSRLDLSGSKHVGRRRSGGPRR